MIQFGTWSKHLLFAIAEPTKKTCHLILFISQAVSQTALLPVMITTEAVIPSREDAASPQEKGTKHAPTAV